MRVKRAFAGVAVMSVLGAGSLRADFRDFSNLCLVASIRTCASIQVFTTVVSGNTQVTMRVANLEGQFFAGQFWDNTGGSLITRIGLVAPPIGAASGLTVNAIGGAGNVNNADSYWTLRSPGVLGGMIEVDATVPFNTANGGIRGCNASAAAATSYFQTCGAGWVEFNFTTVGAWSANNAQVAFLSQFWAVNGSGQECDTDPSTTARGTCDIVSPEPMTVLLLGSGLAGLGGVGLVRRRKENDVENG